MANPSEGLDSGVSEKIQKKIRKAKDEINALSLKGKISLEGVEKEEKKLNAFLKTLNELNDAQRQRGQLNEKEKKQLKKINNDLKIRDKAETKLGKTQDKNDKRSKKRFRENIKELDSFSKVIKFIRGKEHPLSSVAEVTEKIGDGLSGLGGKFSSSSNKIMKGSAKMIKGLGAGLGGVSSAIAKAGPWVAIGTEIVKFEMAQDKFLKDQNKIFSQMRGPDIMSGDVKKQFKDFNDQIFKAMDNIHDGLNVKEVQQFFQAMADSGTAVGKLNNNFQTYRDVVSVAAKASKNWGVDISYMGQASNDLMQDYRADLSTIDDLFNQVAFDAGKSGLSTDKFWSAIKNATIGLGFYGLAFEGLGKTLGEWTKNQIGGAKEASDSLQDLTDTSKMSYDQVMKFVGLSMQGEGGKEFWGKALEKEIAKAKKAKVTASPKQQAQIELRIDRLSKIKENLGDGDAVRMISQNIGEFGGDMAAMHRLMIAGNKDFTGYWDQNSMQYAALISWFKSMGKDPKTATMLAKEMETFRYSLDKLTEISSKPVVINPATFDKLASADEQVQERGIDEFKKALLTAGYDEENADMLSKIAASNKEVRQAFQSGGDVGAALQGIKNNTATSAETITAMENFSGKTDKQIALSAQDTFTQLRDGTLSWEEMVNMGLDEGKYWLASISKADKLNDIVTRILYAVGGKEKGLGTTADKAAKTKAAHGLGIISDMSTVKGQGAAVAEALKKSSLMGKVPQMMGGMTGEFNKKKAIGDVRALSNQVPATALQKDLGAVINKLKEMDAETNPDKMKVLQEELDSLTLAVKTSAEGLKTAYGGLITDLTSNKAVKSADIFTGTTGKMTGKATMREPQLITSPGFVKLDPGEMLQPGNFARTTLATMPSAPGGGPTGGVGGKPITITIYANEKDLPARIANEVRSVLFKERMVG